MCVSSFSTSFSWASDTLFDTSPFPLEKKFLSLIDRVEARVACR